MCEYTHLHLGEILVNCRITDCMCDCGEWSAERFSDLIWSGHLVKDGVKFDVFEYLPHFNCPNCGRGIAYIHHICNDGPGYSVEISTSVLLPEKVEQI